MITLSESRLNVVILSFSKKNKIGVNETTQHEKRYNTAYILTVGLYVENLHLQTQLHGLTAAYRQPRPNSVTSNVAVCAQLSSIVDQRIHNCKQSCTPRKILIIHSYENSRSM